jgi:hypothetical protein
MKGTLQHAGRLSSLEPGTSAEFSGQERLTYQDVAYTTYEKESAVERLPFLLDHYQLLLFAKSTVPYTTSINCKLCFSNYCLPLRKLLNLSSSENETKTAD